MKHIAFNVDKEGDFYRTRCGKLFAVDIFKNIYLVGSDADYIASGYGQHGSKLTKPGYWRRNKEKTTYFGTHKSGNLNNPIHMGKLHSA